MEGLQDLVESYVTTLGFSVPNRREGFLLADKVGFAGSRDTWLLWVVGERDAEWETPQLERRLLRDFEEMSAKYPNSRKFLVVDSTGGLSQEFRRRSEQIGVETRVPIQFFDTPFKHEEAPDIQSAIKELRVPVTRIPQPYSALREGQVMETGEDLYEHLWSQYRSRRDPSLQIIIGPAGVGKSWLFRSLFLSLYQRFTDRKRQHEEFPRPVPLLPEHMHRAGVRRTREVMRSFVEAEVAVPISQSAFEWMLTHGLAIWLFDGLDELYAEDEDFFPYVADLMTREQSEAQILICARESLLTSCETFHEFISDFGADPSVQVHRIDLWEEPSKRAYSKLFLPSPADGRFLRYISSSASLSTLSSLPFYCDILRSAYEIGAGEEFRDDFSLLEFTVNEMIKREAEKQVLRLEDFQPNGVMEWLETVASEYFSSNFTGVDREDVEVYARAVLHPGLSEEEQTNSVTALVQFPLFSAGSEPGVVTFQHELVAEYLAARYLVERFFSDPSRVVSALASRLDFLETPIARFMAGQIRRRPGGTEALRQALLTMSLQGLGFTNLLQLYLLADPSLDAIQAFRGQLEGQNLERVAFNDRSLTGFSFRNCNLTDTLFASSTLSGARFEGARISRTRFEGLKERSLEGAVFGDLDHFESAYVDKKRIESRTEFANWALRMTGQVGAIEDPCPASQQLRSLFLKYVRPDGTGRRDDLPARALTRGKRVPTAASPEDFLAASLEAGYLQHIAWRDRVRRVPGDPYSEVVHFVRDWRLTPGLRNILDEICDIPNCRHVPTH
jgi:hypothetical protein